MSFLTPENEYHVVLLGIDCLNDSISELFPSFLLVGVGDSSPHSQDGVEQEHALSTPGTQVTMDGVWRLELHFGVVLQCLVDVLEGRWNLSTLRNREAQAHGFVLLDVRVLTYDNCLQVLELSLLKGIEDMMAWWEAYASCVLLLHEVVYLAEDWLGKEILKDLLPIT